jgi:hypothetical protein
VLLTFCLLNPLHGHQFLASRPPLPEEGPLNAKPAPADSEAPKASDNQDGVEVEGSLERSDSMLLPPLSESETQVAERKRKHIEDLTSPSFYSAEVLLPLIILGKGLPQMAKEEGQLLVLGLR